MLTPSTVVSPDPNVVFTEMDNGESVLLHLETNQYFSLNETGTLIWQEIMAERNLGEIGGQLENRFEVSSDDAAQSVLTLVGQLVSEKLVSLKSE
ncbi:PqqD family protein [Chloroflexota bacterium]